MNLNQWLHIELGIVFLSPAGNNSFEVDKTTSRELIIPYPEINDRTTSKKKQNNQIKELLIQSMQNNIYIYCKT